MSFPTKLGVLIHLVILLRPPEHKKMEQKSKCNSHQNISIMQRPVHQRQEIYLLHDLDACFRESGPKRLPPSCFLCPAPVRWLQHLWIHVQCLVPTVGLVASVFGCGSFLSLMLDVCTFYYADQSQEGFLLAVFLELPVNAPSDQEVQKV